MRAGQYSSRCARLTGDPTAGGNSCILNEQYEPGDLAYGIPHPGVFVVDPEMNIAGKIFVEDYRVRVDGEGTLAFAQNVLGKQ